MFDGAKRSWSMWKPKFLARSKQREYKEILTSELDVPKKLELEQGTAAEVQEKKRVYELNEKAYGDILLSISGETKEGKMAFKLVELSVDPEHPMPQIC